MSFDRSKQRMFCRLALLGFVTGSLVTGGCGDSSSAPSDSTPTTPSSHRDDVNKKQQNVFGKDAEKPAKAAGKAR